MKKLYKFDKWQIIQLFWLDSMHTNGWKHEDEVNEVTQDKYLLHTSIGFFVKEDKHQICIVQSKSNDGEEKSNVDAIMCIPKVAIKIIKKLK